MRYTDCYNLWCKKTETGCPCHEIVTSAKIPPAVHTIVLRAIGLDICQRGLLFMQTLIQKMFITYFIKNFKSHKMLYATVYNKKWHFSSVYTVKYHSSSLWTKIHIFTQIYLKIYAWHEHLGSTPSLVLFQTAPSLLDLNLSHNRIKSIVCK